MIFKDEGNYISFSDHYDTPCNIQHSSGDTEAIWLGLRGAKPIILCQDAIKLGLKLPDNVPRGFDGEAVGWMDFPVPDDVFINTRMLITRQDAYHLAKILEHYAKTGVLEV